MKRKWFVALVIFLPFFLVMGCGDNGNGDVSENGDGTFSESLPRDDSGWEASLEITIEDGTIVNVFFDEVDEEGTSKREDDEFSQNYEAQAGFTHDEAFEKLEQSLIDTQNPDEVDVISGATGSSQKFIDLARMILD